MVHPLPKPRKNKRPRQEYPMPGVPESAGKSKAAAAAPLAVFQLYYHSDLVRATDFFARKAQKPE